MGIDIAENRRIFVLNQMINDMATTQNTIANLYSVEYFGYDGQWKQRDVIARNSAELKSESRIRNVKFRSRNIGSKFPEQTQELEHTYFVFV